MTGADLDQNKENDCKKYHLYTLFVEIFAITDYIKLS